MQGMLEHGVLTIVFSSKMFGRRQSQWPAKQTSVRVTPSFDSSWRILYKKSEKTVPSGPVKKPEDHVYSFLTQWRSKAESPTAQGVFFSHISPVELSVIVPSPL